MSLLQGSTLWFKKNEAVGAETITTPWYNAEALNAFQSFLKYTGAVNTTLYLDLSPADARGVAATGTTPAEFGGVAPASAMETLTVLSTANNSAAGFCVPTAGGPQDFPFKSYRYRLVSAGSITAVYFCVVRNILGGG